MDNNVNNNTNNNVNVVPSVNSAQPAAVEPQPVAVSEIPVANNTSTIPPVVANQPIANNIDNIQEGYYKKFFIMTGIIVGGVLLISGILLYFLLNGTIENRNRLTCTKTIQGEGYEEHIRRYYTFDSGIMKRVYVTHTFTYDELTEDMYNQTFDEIINNDKHFISKYGLGTSIVKENNVVTINAYDINYFEDEVKDIEKKNKDEKFTCE